MRSRALSMLPVLAMVAGLVPTPAQAQEEFVVWNYAVKFVCGFQRPLTPNTPGETPVKSANYATEINIHNPQYHPVGIRKKVLVLVEKSETPGREPNQVEPRAFDGIELGPDNATMDDCFRLWVLTHPGAAPSTPMVPLIGYLILLSKDELDVDAVYTAATPGNVVGGLSHAISIDVERVEGRQVPITAAQFPGGLDILRPIQPPK